MRAADRVGPDPALVAAARAGDQRALDQLVAQCLPLVYNIVGRALDGHDDVDDVVQETLLRVVRGLADLRDPAAFRSWLVAIAVRQVRDREQARKASWHLQTALDAAELIPDPASDFAAVTILRLGLTDQRRDIAEATRWLDGDDRTLLALWWLEETGDLGRSELAEALGLTRQHAAVKVQRMKEQLETSRAVVRALGGGAECDGLRHLTSGWDGVPSPLWRKRFARHIRNCADCTRRGSALLPMDRLLSGLPLLPVPVGFGGPFAAQAPAAAPFWHPAPPAHGVPQDPRTAPRPTPTAERCAARSAGKAEAAARPRGGDRRGGRHRRRGRGRRAARGPSDRRRPGQRAGRARGGLAGRRHHHRRGHHDSAGHHRIAEPVHDLPQADGAGEQQAARHPRPGQGTAARPAGLLGPQGRRGVVLQRGELGARQVRRRLVLHLVDHPQRGQRPRLRTDDLGQRERGRQRAGAGEEGGAVSAGLQRARHVGAVEHDGGPGAVAVAEAGVDGQGARQPGGRLRR